jgi:signal transduction histidine kinase
MPDLSHTPHAVAHPVMADGLGAALLILLTAPRLLETPSRYTVAQWALQIGLFVPLTWRRRAPLTAFLLIAALAFVQWYGQVLLPTGDIALLVALCSVAIHSRWPWPLLAAGIMEVGDALATAEWAPDRNMIKAFVLLSGTTVAATVLGMNIRTRRAYLISLEDRAARLERERDQQAQIVAAEERSRIAREVHDIVTHSLSVMVALTDGAAYALESSPDRAADAIGKASELGRQAIGEMQRVLEVLREGADAPQLRPQPGLAQLDGLLAEVRAAGLPVEFAVEGERPELGSGAQLAIFRVVQEALTNVRKHAGAEATARVWLRYAPGEVTVEVSDSGGIGVRVGDGRAGHGIAGMRERVAVYGGRLETGPRPAGGWSVRASFLLPDGGAGPGTSGSWESESGRSRLEEVR